MTYFNNNRIIRFINGIIYFLVSTFIISCNNEVNDVDDSQKLNEEINYLALGDSYTIGQGVEEFERWPNQLVEDLKRDNYDINLAGIIAKTGWTSNNLLRAIDNTELGDYNLVSLLIGVNNQFQGRPFSSFEDELETLLNFSIETAGSNRRVFVVSIPDYGVTPFGRSNSERIREEIDRYNEYIADQCLEKNIQFINITEISRELGSSDGALAADNLHPSGNQYNKWVEKIIHVVIELLNE